MFPPAFRKRIEKQNYIDSEQLIRALDEPSPVTIRINRCKWLKKPLNSSPVPWCNDGFYLDNRPSFTFDPLFHAGCYYPQEASGMILEQVFRQVKPESEFLKILDLCGAPGGKSTHLSTLTGEKGLIVSNEVIRSRADILIENITRWGIPNVIVTRSDPSSFGRLPGFFDIILADAPCSGEGMFRNLTARNEWSEGNAAMCSVRQKRILMDVWPALKENGILIYSTCTFNPAENEENISWLSEKARTESVKMDLSGFKGITEIDHKGIYGYGFYPGNIRGEGFFISVLRKKEKLSGKSQNVKADGSAGISRNELIIASALFDNVTDRLLKYNDEIIALPCTYSDYRRISDVLRIVKAGTRLFKMMNIPGGQNHVPLHDLVLSVNCKKEIYPLLDLSLDQAQVFLSRGQFTPEKSQSGWNIVRYDSVNLGLINNIGSRINNYYPMDWRIRTDLRKSSDDKLIEWHQQLKY